MTSKIQWNKGLPHDSGNYLTTLNDGSVRILYWFNSYTNCKYWEGVEDDEDVVAWCDISSIEPCEE